MRNKDYDVRIMLQRYPSMGKVFRRNVHILLPRIRHTTQNDRGAPDEKGHGLSESVLTILPITTSSRRPPRCRDPGVVNVCVGYVGSVIIGVLCVSKSEYSHARNCTRAPEEY